MNNFYDGYNIYIYIYMNIFMVIINGLAIFKFSIFYEFNIVYQKLSTI